MSELMPTSPPTLVVAAVIERRGRLLLAQRPAGKELAHHWEFPGGKVAPGESTADALARELLEELALVEVSVGAELARIPDPRRSLELLFLRVVTTAPPIPLEHQALGWYNASEAQGLRLAPLDLHFLQRHNPLEPDPSSSQETPS